MTRPQSIVRFEWLYGTAFVLGLVSTAQTWGAQARMLDGDPALTAMPWLPMLVVAIRVLIAAALWYFVARSPSVVAKWIVVVLAGWGVILLAMVLWGVSSGTTTIDIALPVIVQNILYVAAAAMLFRPDARLWFGETGKLEDAA